MLPLRPQSAVRPRSIRVLLATAGWPSGILEIGSWAARQPDVEVVILQISADQDGILIDRLQSWRPQVVGFRVEGEPFEPILRWIRTVREVSNAEIVLGGPTATSHPIDLLEWSEADYVFAGEAEETFAQYLQFARRPNSRDLLPEIPGAAYRYGGRTFHNTLPTDGYGRSILEKGTSCPETPVSDSNRTAMSSLSVVCLPSAVRPIASQEMLAANRLDWSLLDGFQQPFDSLYFTCGRGCPGACTFCAKLHGAQVRLKSAQQLLEEIHEADACVATGRLHLTRWPLFAHVHDDHLRSRQASWAAVYDEDFFLHRQRAIEFFELWSRSPLNQRYRLSLQTNPCSLLSKKETFSVSSARGQDTGRMSLTGPKGALHEADLSSWIFHPELLHWIDRMKPMVQLGAESFNPVLLNRWRKRHTMAQLNCVLDALDSTRQDYTVFQLLTDFDTTAEELIETLRLLILAALTRPRMRIASNPYTIPLYDSDIRKSLEFSGRLPDARRGMDAVCGLRSPARKEGTVPLGPPRPKATWHRLDLTALASPACVRDFRDYERPHPEWMNPLVADLADLADEQLHWALNPETRSGALSETMPLVIEHLRQLSRADHPNRDELLAQAQTAAEQIAAARFQPPR